MKQMLIALFACVCVCAASIAADAPVEKPKDAVVLFDGKDASKWVHKKTGEPIKWKLVEEDAMEVAGGGDIISKDKFSDFTLHVEFRCPSMPDKQGQAKGNSGIYIQDRYELQILDSYGLQSKDNDCGGFYKIKAPDVNACKPPGQWQTYDITFRAARFDASGKKTANAKVTVVQNGTVIHKDLDLPKETAQGEPEGATPGPMRLQDHGNPVRFRNIWIVPVDTSKEAK